MVEWKWKWKRVWCLCFFGVSESASCMISEWFSEGHGEVWITISFSFLLSAYLMRKCNERSERWRGLSTGLLGNAWFLARGSGWKNWLLSNRKVLQIAYSSYRLSGLVHYFEKHTLITLSGSDIQNLSCSIMCPNTTITLPILPY